MFRSKVFRSYKSPKIKNCFRNIVQSSNRVDELTKHAYYQKTLTKNELLQLLKDNVVFESNEYIVSSVPAGLPFKKNKTWIDTVSPLVAEVDFNDILEDLPEIFNTNIAWLTKYPRRNASGVTIFSKSHESCRKLNHCLNLAPFNQAYVYTFLALVLGCPPKSYSQIFGLKSVEVDGKYGTEILFKCDSKKIQKCHYKHEVLDSSDFISLVKVDLSNDNRDCVRHILASVCLTPILGDYWNYMKRKSSVFGVPIAVSPAVNRNSVELEPNLLAKLNLQPGEEKLIPIHSHLLSVKTTLKKRRIFIASASPPSCFVWTCKQMGFSEINKFILAERS